MGNNTTLILSFIYNTLIASGAVLQVAYDLSKGQGKKLMPYRIKDVFLGPGFTNDEA
jgi:hypothetical protein